ncbi:hypothetical protein Taro_035327 [Colocasia esculenta]|uniref:Uncharacterized protein n=1 Tax=Colocasia esculenta TaxID=4460 RepID=A0A843W5F4_COLES|nr:hypothetical protein [Colocasia esculenta]
MRVGVELCSNILHSPVEHPRVRGDLPSGHKGDKGSAGLRLEPASRREMGVSPSLQKIEDQSVAVQLFSCSMMSFGRRLHTCRKEVKKPTSWYKTQCASARLKPLARFYTVYSPTAGHKSFLEKKEQTESYYKMNTKNSSSQPQTLPQIYNDHKESEERRRSLKLKDCQPLGGLRGLQV